MTERTILANSVLCPIEDDDDIDWKYNPFDVDFIDEADETPQQLMSQITFEGSPQLQKRLKALVLEPANVEPMKIVIDEDKWRLPCNRAPARKKKEIRKQKSRKRFVSKLMCS